MFGFSRLGGAWLAAALGAVAVVSAGGYWLFAARSPAHGAFDASVAPARALPADPPRSDGRRVDVTPLDGRALVGRNQRWQVAIVDASGAPVRSCLVTLDAQMPEHGHGLPTTPRTLGEPEAGRYVVDGVRFSMPGRWELLVSARGCGVDSHHRFTLTL